MRTTDLIRSQVILDVHKHAQKDEVHKPQAIYSVMPSEFDPQPGVYYTIGVHPWYLENADEELVLLRKLITHPQVVGVGECGLDPHSDFDQKLQRRVFFDQLQIANEFKKPVMLHMVRLTQWAEKAKKDSKFSNIPAWVMHGYRGRSRPVLNLVRLGFYFSIGFKASDVCALYVPKDLMLLESDEETASMYEHIEHIAKVRSEEPYDVVITARENASRVFFPENVKI